MTITKPPLTGLYDFWSPCTSALQSTQCKHLLFTVYMSPAEWISQAEWIKIANINFFKHCKKNEMFVFVLRTYFLFIH